MDNYGDRKKEISGSRNGRPKHRSYKISRIERIRNDRIKEIMKIKGTLLDDIQKKKLIWYGHDKRMNDERLPKITFNYETNKKRKRLRPRKNWMDDISKAMRDRGLEEEWTFDRKKWKKTLVDSSDSGI